MDRVLDEHFGPERPEESGPIPGEAAEAVEADARFADPGEERLPSSPVAERLPLPARVDLTLVSSMKNVGDEAGTVPATVKPLPVSRVPRVQLGHFAPSANSAQRSRSPNESCRIASELCSSSSLTLSARS